MYIVSAKFSIMKQTIFVGQKALVHCMINAKGVCASDKLKSKNFNTRWDI